MFATTLKVSFIKKTRPGNKKLDRSDTNLTLNCPKDDYKFLLINVVLDSVLLLD